MSAKTKQIYHVFMYSAENTFGQNLYAEPKNKGTFFSFHFMHKRYVRSCPVSRHVLHVEVTSDVNFVSMNRLQKHLSVNYLVGVLSCSL